MNLIKQHYINAIYLSFLVLTSCGGDHRPPDIFNYDIGNEANQKYKIEKTHCPDCSSISLRQLYTPFTEPLVFQLNPFTYGGYYEEAKLLSSDVCKAGIPPRDEKDLGTPPTFTKRESARNALIGASLHFADIAISNHLANIKSTEVDINLLLGGATAGLTGGASVAAAGAAKALSAAATGTNAFKSIFNETTYRNALGETLISAIDADLISKKHDILEKLLYSCIDSYPVEIALDDVQNYKDSGAFYNGLALVRKAAEQNTTKKIDAVKTDAGDGLAKIPGVTGSANSADSNKSDQNTQPKTTTTAVPQGNPQ